MRKLTIGMKILLGFAIVIALFIGVLVEYHLTLETTKGQYDKLIAQDLTIQRDVEEVVSKMLQLRRNEKDFLLRLDTKYLDKFNKNFKSLHSTIDRVEANSKLSGLTVVTSLAGQMKGASDKYNDKFHELVEVWKKNGLNQKSGTQGQFRASVHKLGDMLKKYPDTKALLLEVRKQEKDYLLRRNPIYIKNTHAALLSLQSYIEKKNLSAGKAALARRLIKDYRVNFNQLVKGDNNLKVITGEMRTAIHGVAPLAERIVKLVAESTMNKKQAVAETVSNSSRLALTLAFAATILGLLFALIFNRGISKILHVVNQQISGLIMSIKSGNLKNRGDDKSVNFEFRPIITGLNDALDGITAPLDEAMGLMTKLSNKDLTSRMVGHYKGDLDTFKNNINSAISDMDDSMVTVKAASSQIEAGAAQISSASQSLSQGACEQASAIEEISSSITIITSQVNQNSENAAKAQKLSAEATKVSEVGNQKMNMMVDAMESINEASKEIATIVKVIESISFQTNLLALNAAVEAARAGKHGKGFAVVAEEVRSLASSSDKAAKEIAQMIGDSLSKVDAGGAVAKETSEALNEIVTKVEQVSMLVSSIDEASIEQSRGMKEINAAISQIDSVVQQNTASSEEVAASSEELSSQAVEQMSTVNQFSISEFSQMVDHTEAAEPEWGEQQLPA